MMSSASVLFSATNASSGRFSWQRCQSFQAISASGLSAHGEVVLRGVEMSNEALNRHQKESLDTHIALDL